MHRFSRSLLCVAVLFSTSCGEGWTTIDETVCIDADIEGGGDWPSGTLDPSGQFRIESFSGTVQDVMAVECQFGGDAKSTWTVTDLDGRIWHFSVSNFSERDWSEYIGRELQLTLAGSCCSRGYGHIQVRLNEGGRPLLWGLLSSGELVLDVIDSGVTIKRGEEVGEKRRNTYYAMRLQAGSVDIQARSTENESFSAFGHSYSFRNYYCYVDECPDDVKDCIKRRHAFVLQRL